MEIYTKSDNIEEYLIELRELVKLEWMEINMKRAKNKRFIEKYHLRDKDIKRILLEIESKDFVEKIKTQDFAYNSEYLYVFKKVLLLDDVEDAGDDVETEIEVNIYIKTSIPDGSKYKTMIVVSFHEDE